MGPYRPDHAAQEHYAFTIDAGSSGLDIAFLNLYCRMPATMANLAWISCIAEGDTITISSYIRDNMEWGSLPLDECHPASE